MTVSKKAKISLNSLIVAQAGVLVTGVVSAFIFYGSQVEINKSTAKFIKKQEDINLNMENKIFNVSVQAGYYASKEWVTRELNTQKIKHDTDLQNLRAVISDNQRETIKRIDYNQKLLINILNKK